MAWLKTADTAAKWEASKEHNNTTVQFIDELYSQGVEFPS